MGEVGWEGVEVPFASPDDLGVTTYEPLGGMAWYI